MKHHPTKPVASPGDSMTPREKTPLAIAARQAFDFQASLGNLDSAQTFDAWRRAEVQAVVGLPGLSACSHHHYRPLMAHFQHLAGRDASAYRTLVTTGAASTAPGDTHETRRLLAHQILAAIAAHLRLAHEPMDSVLAAVQDPAARARLRAAAAAIAAHPRGPITPGYLVWLVRQKTCRPDLTLGPDLRAALADRCSANQLDQIRSTLRNRIAAREGRGSTAGRNRSQRSRKPAA